LNAASNRFLFRCFIVPSSYVEVGCQCKEGGGPKNGVHFTTRVLNVPLYAGLAALQAVGVGLIAS
jgi:hypothetical protein